MENKLLLKPIKESSAKQPIEELYLGCLAQNPRTQRELFDRLYTKMLSLCKRYVPDTAAAEDVLMVAFRKVFDRIGQFRQTGSFEGWIRRIVVNECLMYLEKESRWLKESISETVNYQNNQAGPADELHLEDMMRVIKLLPKGYRKVFELFILEGYSHEEIGNQLDISESTSKSQLSRARVQLQKMLRLQA